jgi:hypothetical protein
MVRASLGEDLFSYRKFSFHNDPVQFVNGITWPHFDDYFKLLIGRAPEPDDDLANVPPHKLMDVFFLTFAENSIQQPYGSYEVQICLYTRLFRPEAATAASPLAVLAEAKDLMLSSLSEVQYARIVAVVRKICEDRVATIMPKTTFLKPNVTWELKYHNIWEEALPKPPGVDFYFDI